MDTLSHETRELLTVLTKIHEAELALYEVLLTKSDYQEWSKNIRRGDRIQR